MSQSTAKSLKVTLVRSTNGQLQRHRATVLGLGLKRIRDTRVVGDTPEIRGMIRSARHLLKVENL